MENSWNFRKKSWVTNSTVSWIKQKGNFRKTSTSVSLITPKPLTVWITTNWKIVKEMRNTKPPYLSPEKPVFRSRSNRTKQGTTYWFTIGKGACQGCILSPFLFNFYAEYIMQNAGLDEAQAGIKNCWEKYQQPQICRWYYSNGRKCWGAKSLLMKVKKRVKKLA